MSNRIPSTLSVRRLACVGVAGLLAAGVGLHPAPAHATATGGVVQARASGHAGYSGTTAPSGCTTALPTGRQDRLEHSVDGVARTARLDRSGRVATSTARATGAITSSSTTTSSGVTRLRASGSVAVSLKPTAAHATCSASLYGTISAGIQTVQVPARSWVVAASTATRRGETYGSLGLAEDETYEYVAITRPGNSITALVSPGTYTAVAEIEASAYVGMGSTAARASSASMSASIDIVPVGTRRTHAGKARRYLRVGNRDCTRNSVRATVTRKARKSAQQITIYVNGKKRTVLKGRELRRKGTAIKRIPAASAGQVRAVVTMKSGATRKMSSTSWPCR